MGYIYSVVFDNKIAKFGRASDLMRRIREHKVGAGRHDVGIARVFFSTVLDEVREEARILECAKRALSQVSQESFEVSDMGQVADVFRDARLPFCLMKVVSDPFKLVFDPAGDSNAVAGVSFSSEASSSVGGIRLKMQDEALAAVKEVGGWVKFSDVRDRMSRRRSAEVRVALETLTKAGTLRHKPWVHPFSREPSKDVTKGWFSLPAASIIAGGKQ